MCLYTEDSGKTRWILNIPFEISHAVFLGVGKGCMCPCLCRRASISLISLFGELLSLRG